MEKNDYVIYKHTAPSGKSYIGLTGNYKQRCKNHQKARSYCPAFKSAIEKYGWDAFSHAILHSGLTLEEANRLEVIEIELNNSVVPNGYNLTTGGGSLTQYSDVSKRKMRNAQLGKVLSTETKLKIQKALTGVPKSPLAVEKSATSRKGQVTTEATREKLRLAHTTREFYTKHTMETKALISQKLRGKTRTLEFKEKMRQQGLGRIASEATRKKIGDAARGRTASEQTKAKLSSASLSREKTIRENKPTRVFRASTGEVVQCKGVNDLFRKLGGRCLRISKPDGSIAYKRGGIVYEEQLLGV